MKITTIKWIDHFSCAGEWSFLEEIREEPYVCTTIGYKIKETDEYIYLAQTKTQDNKFLHVQAILKSAIIKKVGK